MKQLPPMEPAPVLDIPRSIRKCADNGQANCADFVDYSEVTCAPNSS